MDSLLAIETDAEHGLDKLAQALTKAQAEIKGARSQSTNPFFNSSYADLHTVIQCHNSTIKTTHPTRSPIQSEIINPYTILFTKSDYSQILELY